MEPGYIVFYFFNIVISCFGIYLHAFISVVSYRTWLNHTFRSPQGLLLFCIGFSSAVFEVYQLCIDISSFIWTAIFTSPNICLFFIYCVFTSCTFFSMCQTSLLCSFYCIKLVSVQHRILRLLKSRLPSILPWIIAGALVISGIVLVLMFGMISISVPVDNIDNSTSHCRRINETYIVRVMVIANGFDLLIVLPYCLILVSLSCTVSALVRHIRRVQGTFSLDRSHLEAHTDAVKTMLLLLALNTSFYASNVLLTLKILPVPWVWVGLVIYYLFWPFQALTLIFRTKKLHSHFIHCLCGRTLEKM